MHYLIYTINYRTSTLTMWKLLVVLSVTVVVTIYTETVTVQSINSEFGDDPRSDEDDGSSEESGKDEEHSEDDDEGPPYPPNPPPTSSNAFTMETTESASTRKSTQNPNNANSYRTTNTTNAIVTTTEAPSVETTLNTGYLDQQTTETTPFPVGHYKSLRSKFAYLFI